MQIDLPTETEPASYETMPVNATFPLAFIPLWAVVHRGDFGK